MIKSNKDHTDEEVKEMFKNAKGFDPVFGINKEYTDEEVKEIFANVPKIKDTKDMFVGVDWEEQQKGVDKVKETIKDWKAPDYNLSEMFCGDENKTLNKDSKAPDCNFAIMFSGCESVTLEKLKELNTFKDNEIFENKTLNND